MRILVVTHYFPMPDRQADNLRLVEILKVLAESHQVTIYITDDSGQRIRYGEAAVADYRAALDKIGVSVALESAGDDALPTHDIVLFEHYRLASTRVERMRALHPDAIVIVDTVDIAYLRVAMQNRVDGSSMVHESGEAKETELDVYRKADVVIAISRTEQAILQNELPRKPVHVIPLIMNVLPFAPRTTRPCRLLFVGNFTYSANVAAIDFFLKRIFPLVRERIPDATLTILGNYPPASLSASPPDGVIVAGFVPSLSPHYKRANISIAPLTWGGGLKGKVAEAMAHNLPVVTTSTGASGFDIESGKHAIVADDPYDFAMAIVHLVSDPELYERVRHGGWTLVAEHYSRQAARKSIDELLEMTARVVPERLDWPTRLKLRIRIAYHRYFAWRFASHA